MTETYRLLEAQRVLNAYYALDELQRDILNAATRTANGKSYSESLSAVPETKKIKVKIPSSKGGAHTFDGKITFYI